MNLALALVEDDAGRAVAHVVARELVMFLRRPGSQSQFSVPLWSVQPAFDPIRAVVSAINADPGGEHGLAELASRAGLSPRHFQRKFTAEVGTPPAAYVERVRIEAAQRALAESDVLVHSPVTGPSVWRWVAAELAARGHRVSVPAVGAVGRWQDFADSCAGRRRQRRGTRGA